MTLAGPPWETTVGGRQRDTPGYRVYLMGKGIVEEREREREEGGKGEGGRESQ